MSETVTKQKIDIPALREALAKSTPGEWIDPGPGDDCIYAGESAKQKRMALAMFVRAENRKAIVVAHNQMPALLDELEELRRLTTPEPIGEKHRDGGWWLVWDKWAETWRKAKWSIGMEC